MKPLLTALGCAIVAAILMTPASATGEPGVEVEATQLLSEPEEWNGRRVVVTGELVGDYSLRDDGVWVQLNGDSFVGSPIGAGGVPDETNTGIGARIFPDTFADLGGPPGRYGRTGPVVRLEGVFIHSDPTLQGETYIAVDAATTLTPARDHPTPGADLWLPIGVALLALAVFVLYFGRRRNRIQQQSNEKGSTPPQ